MKRTFMPFLLILLFFVMLIKPQETFHGASEGLLLWFQIVLPTLFPFILISNLLVSTNTMSYIARILSPIIRPFFHTSQNGTFVVLSGFLCGYPMGAKVTADLVASGKISTNEGSYLLSFTNNTSPMFLMNYVVLKIMHREELLLPSVIIAILSPVLCSFLFRLYYFRRRTPNIDTNHIDKNSSAHFDFRILDDTIMNAFETITKVGGYIILFSVLLTLAGELPFHSKIWKLFLLPSLEITNGLSMLASARLPFSFTFLLMMSLVSFGGLCSIAQTQCMIQNSGLKIIPYIIEKLITAAVTSLLSFLYIKL